MKTFVLRTAFVLAMALSMPYSVYAAEQNAGSAEAAAARAAGKTVTTSAVRATNNQTAVACNVCFTCGGDWPVFAGSIRSSGTQTERGSSCSGTLSARTDSTPFLCCR